MKRLYIIVEGQTEQEFVREMLVPHFQQYGLYDVHPILIHTSPRGRGGFVSYQHLKKDVQNLLKSEKEDFVVSMFVDFFRIPEVPNKEKWEHLPTHREQIEVMQQCIAADIDDKRFIPYIQLHEFEALLFSSNIGFETFFSDKESEQTLRIVEEFDNPEEINSGKETAPSKRILAIKPAYDKVLEGNLIALQIGLPRLLSRCPRFREWINTLLAACS